MSLPASLVDAGMHPTLVKQTHAARLALTIDILIDWVGSAETRPVVSRADEEL